MQSLEAIKAINKKIADKYFAETLPRQRLINRLNGLNITTKEQNEAILNMFDQYPEYQEKISNADIDILVKLSKTGTMYSIIPFLQAA